jgi:rubrerythrin
MGVINTDKYKAISDNIASAKAQLTYAVAQMYSAVYTIALLDDIIQSVDLIQPMSTVYELTDNTFSRTSLFDGAVLAINNHVLRRSADHSLNAFLETDGTKVAPLFAELSANLGFIISEGNIEAAKEAQHQITESKEHAEQFAAVLAKAEKRFAALKKVEERHANAYKKVMETL